MCIRDRPNPHRTGSRRLPRADASPLGQAPRRAEHRPDDPGRLLPQLPEPVVSGSRGNAGNSAVEGCGARAVSYTHLRAHETVLDLVCRLLLEKKNKHNTQDHGTIIDRTIYSPLPQREQ